MIKVAIIDDEQLAVDNLQYFLKQFPDLDVVGATTEVDELMNCLKNNEVQLIFLDIEMPEMNGLELASHIIEDYKDIEIIFATAYNQYAVQAFELNAVDYILKPLSMSRIEKTVEKIRKRIPRTRETKVEIKCLGGFDILVNDKIIPFKLTKAKEILAYLIQANGKSVGWMTIADDVWPDALDDKKLMNNFHVASFSLRTFLADNGIANIFDYSRNVYRVDTSKFTCDYLTLIDVYREFKKTKEIKIHPITFKTGEYLENLDYMWAFSTGEKVEQMILEMERYEKMKK
ncbi:MAG: response regulator [Bacilli bacterium]|nr:response regulator [Bacilli bacterium]